MQGHLNVKRKNQIKLPKKKVCLEKRKIMGNMWFHAFASAV